MAMKEKLTWKNPDFVSNLAEKLSVNLFLKFFDKLGIAPNKITVINFFTNNLLAVYFFSRGTYLYNLVGLFFCGLSVIADYMDGAIARKRGIESKLGGWLDPTVDFIWQNMLLCGIIYGVFISKDKNLLWLGIGLFALICVIVANHMSYLYAKTFDLDPYRISPDFVKSIKVNRSTKTLDRLCMNIITPTNFLFVLLFTLRYFIVVGAIFNIMHIALLMIMIFFLIKAAVLLFIYSLFLQYDKQKTTGLELIKVLHKRYNG